MAKASKARARRISPTFPAADGRLALLLAAAAMLLGARVWLAENPQHNPWASLDLRDPHGLFTGAKLASLRGDIPACHAVLNRSEVTFTSLEPAIDGECARPDRVILGDTLLVPADPQMTCPVAAGLSMWIDQDVQRLARDILGSSVIRVEQLGTYSCRRMYGAPGGDWSEHATGNAIDISAFILADGRQISLLEDWEAGSAGDNASARFLRETRDSACRSFGTVLSPDYNAAHADHFHLDQARSPDRGICR
ncbi:extensin family protein [Aurantiacibacter marinus]|uniref:Extensin-like C-terminal domain-containing protein n=1 Tax=Aurantiacibacter marinus TaxID=874156 RepID=A0A0H0XTY7_9SPHN|nr:extensin family protein [Aurantiacibacter marinus]KLI63780.1 hypothetical protein AAV99_08675 [Aurantiacibacter marinus]